MRKCTKNYVEGTLRLYPKYVEMIKEKEASLLNPYEFMYYEFDEDEGTGDGWTGIDLYNPLRFQTEKAFLSRLEEEAE